MITADELLVRGTDTLLACWEEYARGTTGAQLHRLDGVAAAVFPSGPESAFLNNAVLERGLDRSARGRAIDAMEASYRSAGVDRYAAWVHESDEPMCAELAGRGYVVEESTRAMGRGLDDLPSAWAEVEVGLPDWDGYLQVLGVPGLFGGIDRSAFHPLVARLDGDHVATAVAFDHDGDCGVYNVTTVESARRRGLGSALTAQHLLDAVGRGCTTATLQSTPMAERVYAQVGFRDLGRILEHVPPTATGG